MTKAVVAAALLSVLAVGHAGAQTIVAAPPHTANFDGFIVTEGDISDRPYSELGTVTAKAGKLTWSAGTPIGPTSMRSL